MTRVPPPPSHNADNGFTLLEVMVALAVLGVGAVSLLTATQTHAARITEIELRTVARWVADSQITALRVGLDPSATTTAMGRSWTTEIRQTATSDTGLMRADITVQNTGRDVYQLTGFVNTITRGGTP